MSKTVYKSSEQVCVAMLREVNPIKRKSVLELRRRYLQKGDISYADLLQRGVDLYDNHLSNQEYLSLTGCSSKQ